jgi:hypothetical protein
MERGPHRLVVTPPSNSRTRRSTAPQIRDVRRDYESPAVWSTDQDWPRITRRIATSTAGVTARRSCDVLTKPYAAGSVARSPAPVDAHRCSSLALRCHRAATPERTLNRTLRDPSVGAV